MYRESIYSNASTPLGEMPPSNQQNLWPGPPPTHPYQYPPPTQEPNNRYSQAYSPQYAYHNQPPQTSGAYVQPHYGATSAPSFIAELPAPLPPAPPTTTPQQQLTEDERLAHKIQQMELEEARKRSSTIGSTVSQQHSPPTPHLGTHSPRPHSHSFSSASTYHPQPSGLPPLQGTPSLLPEVVQGPRPVSFHEAARPHSQVEPPSPGPHFAPHLPPAPTDPASLSAYLEQHRQVPYPPQWRLAPIVATFYASSTPASKSDWLDIPESRSWRTVRFSENARNPTPPSFFFHFKSKGGSFRDPRFMWTMTCGNGKKDKISKVQYPTWTYELRLDRNTAKRKTESLAHAKGRDMLTTFVHALNYDSLRFIGPDGRAYMWVSHAPVSSVNGARYDTLRHALFVSTETARDPLFGQIIADHTHWDGFVDTAEVHTGTTCAGCNASTINGLRWVCRTCPSHNLCDMCCKANVSNTIEPSCDMSLVSLPDEALYIRSTHVDPALVVASLQVLKDWEMHTIREQRTKDPRGFDISVEKARQYDLGRMSYWRPGDLDTKATDAKFGTVIKAKECMQAAAEVASALGNLAEPIFDASGGDGGGGGGDGGGGGGEGGGGGGA